MERVFKFVGYSVAILSFPVGFFVQAIQDGFTVGKKTWLDIK